MMGSELGLGSTFQGKVLHFMLPPVTCCATLNQFPQNTKLHKIIIITYALALISIFVQCEPREVLFFIKFNKNKFGVIQNNNNK